MEEFNLQTEKTTKFTQQEFVAVSPLSSRSCNKENNKKELDFIMLDVRLLFPLFPTCHKEK